MTSIDNNNTPKTPEVEIRQPVCRKLRKTTSEEQIKRQERNLADQRMMLEIMEDDMYREAFDLPWGY
jgi:hypothetical protein